MRLKIITRKNVMRTDFFFILFLFHLLLLFSHQVLSNECTRGGLIVFNVNPTKRIKNHIGGPSIYLAYNLCVI